jgi:hypothetical protein
MWNIVIPAKAGISARLGSALLPEIPAYAGMTAFLPEHHHG